MEESEGAADCPLEEGAVERRVEEAGEGGLGREAQQAQGAVR